MPDCEECVKNNEQLCKRCKSDRFPEGILDNKGEVFKHCRPCDRKNSFVREINGRKECQKCRDHIENCDVCERESSCERCSPGFFQLSIDGEVRCSRCTGGDHFIEDKRKTDGSGKFTT